MALLSWDGSPLPVYILVLVLERHRLWTFFSDTVVRIDGFEEMLLIHLRMFTLVFLLFFFFLKQQKFNSEICLVILLTRREQYLKNTNHSTVIKFLHPFYSY